MLWGIGKERDHDGLDGLDGGEARYIVGHIVAVALLVYPLSLAGRHKRCAMYNHSKGSRTTCSSDQCGVYRQP